MRISCEELFGPAVAVTPVGNLDEALELSNDSKYGLGAGIFTRDVTQALKFARGVESGNVMINWTPLGGRTSCRMVVSRAVASGRREPRYSVEEMTETKTVVFHGLE